MPILTVSVTGALPLRSLPETMPRTERRWQPRDGRGGRASVARAGHASVLADPALDVALGRVDPDAFRTGRPPLSCPKTRSARRSMAESARHYTVLGAGTVGVCCALYLQRDGHRVTLIDRISPGNGCSYGNGGIIQIGACVPIATPGVLRQVPTMLLDPEGPLIIRWRHLARLAPYLLRFVAAARPARVEAIAKTLASVLGGAIDAYRPLIASAGAQGLIRDTGEMYVYHTDAAFEAARPAHDLRRRNGVNIVDVPLEELRQIEPALASTFK